MTDDKELTFLVDRDKHTITVERMFAAKRQTVWDCYSKAELLDRWFAPKPLVAKTKEMDFRDGGRWHFAMVDGDGNEYWNRFDYETIRPIDGYTALDGFADAAGAINPDMPRARWDVTFTDEGERCRVRTIVTYKSAEDIDKVIAMGVEAGMAATLDNLDDLLLALVREQS